MKQLPNEGLLTLEDIRHLEFGESLYSEINDNDFEFDYDPNFRFTEVRSIDELSFAFTMKEKKKLDVK